MDRGACGKERRMDHWQYFNWPNILSEAKARLEEARKHTSDLPPL
jgi:hypothetical protein